MKKFLTFVIALCLFALPALAETTTPTISITGSASVSMTPDYANVTIGANISADTVAKATAENANVIAAIIEALKAKGLTDEDITTASFNVSPRYDYADYTSPRVTGYQVEHMLNITVKNLDDLGAVLDSAMTAGANQTYGIVFLSTQQQKAADEALKNAIAEGIRKAELAAAAAGKELGGIIAITENPGGYTPYITRNEKLMDTAAGTQIQAGTVEVSVSVEVKFELK